MRPLFILPLVACLAACSGDAPASSETETSAEAVDIEETPPFFVGRWAADPLWCTDQTNGFPITIAAARFEGRENICEMDAVTDTPEGGWTADLTCQSEGMTVEEPINFSPVGDQLAITWPDRDTETTLFTRCEPL